MSNSICFDSKLMYELAWKSESACSELWRSEYFRPKPKSSFKIGETQVNAELFEEGLYFEEVQNGEVISTHYINKSGVHSPVRF